MNTEIVSQDFDRFWSRVDKCGDNDCWPWQAGTDSRGYGKIRWCGAVQLAHRVAWQLVNGLVPVGSNVLQRCRCASCCNPDHLYLGTQSPRRKRRDVPRVARGTSARVLPTELRRENAQLRRRISELEEVIQDLERNR